MLQWCHRRFANRRRIARERGQATTEYILIIAMLVIPIAVAFNKMREVLADLLDSLFLLVYGPGV